MKQLYRYFHKIFMNKTITSKGNFIPNSFHTINNLDE